MNVPSARLLLALVVGVAADARHAAPISDAGLIGGGVLFGVGAALVLFTSSGPSESAAGLRVTPPVAADRAGLSVGGRW